MPPQTERPSRRLNTTLLADEGFCKHISTALHDILTNKSNSTSPSLLWETLKAVIRGEIISYSSTLNKARKQKQEQLIDSINKLDQQYSTSPTSELYKEMLGLQTEYNLLSTEKTEQCLLRSRGYVYEHGEKAGRLLAHQLKCKSASQLIPQIYNTSHVTTVDPVEINYTFKAYYSQLYTSEFPKDTLTMTTFFENLNVPTISHDQKNKLDEPVLLVDFHQEDVER